MRTKAWLVMGAAAALVLGTAAGTLALFTASAPTNNQVQAGTLVVSSYRDNRDTINGPMFYTTAAEGVSTGGLPGRNPTGPWAPGDSVTRILIVENHGTLDAKLTAVGATMHPGTSRHLAEKLEVEIRAHPSGAVLASGTMADFIDADQVLGTPIPLPVGSTITAIQFNVTLPLDADNSYQAESLKVDFHVLAEQVRNNP